MDKPTPNTVAGMPLLDLDKMAEIAREMEKNLPKNSGWKRKEETLFTHSAYNED